MDWMRSLFNIIRVLWLFLWAGIATIVLAVPIISAGLLSRTGNLGFSLSKIWAWTMLAVSFVRKGSLVVRPGKIQVVVGEPIDTGSYTHENVDALIDKTRRTVIANFDPGYAGRFFA
jgi:1-acyl-sn-glycerol-3-phosphate acyltransferase